MPLIKLPQTSTNQIYLAVQSLVKTSLSYFESHRKIFTHTFVRACIIFSRTRLPGACRRTDVCGYEIIDQVHQIAGTSGSLEFQFRLSRRGVRSFVDLGARNTKKSRAFKEHARRGVNWNVGVERIVSSIFDEPNSRDANELKTRRLKFISTVARG